MGYFNVLTMHYALYSNGLQLWSFIFLLSAVFNLSFICSFFFTLSHLQSAIYSILIYA